MIDIRPFVAADAPRLAALLNRSQYGPAEHGQDLSAGTLLDIFTERCVTDCFVGDDGTDLVGCLAFARGSGRRSAGRHERFAGLYVVDRRHRNSMLSGRLFRDAFSAVVRAGEVRTLRIEANPVNTRAFPLYLRAGFRSLPGARPDEDGYLELVSHLPGVVQDVFDACGGVDVDAVAPQLNWRMMRAGRSIDPAEGVSWRDGRWVAQHHIDAGDLAFEVTVDVASGVLLDLVQSGGDPVVAATPSGVAPLDPEPEELVVWPLADGHALALDDAGTLVLRHGGNVLLRERWPVARGVDAPAVRRQGARRRVTVSRSADLRWQLLAADDPISREVVLLPDGDGFDLVTRTSGEQPPIVSGWWGPTVHELAVQTSAGWRAGPFVPGVHPEVATDFEASCPWADAQTVWTAAADSACSVSWSGARARIEGRLAPQLHAIDTVDPVVEHVRFGVPRPASAHPASERATAVSPARRRKSPTRSPEPASSGAATPTPVVADGVDVGPHTLRTTADGLLVEWCHQQARVLGGAWPHGAPLGSLVRRRGGLWAHTVAAHHLPDPGIEWCEDSESLPLGSGPGQLSLLVLDDASLLVSAQPPEGRCSAITLVPEARGGAPVVLRLGRRTWKILPGRPWRVSAAAVALELADGRGLTVAAETPGSEVFVRQFDIHLVLQVLGGHDTPASARLTVVATQAVAERLVSGGGRG